MLLHKLKYYMQCSHGWNFRVRTLNSSAVFTAWTLHYSGQRSFLRMLCAHLLLDHVAPLEQTMAASVGGIFAKSVSADNAQICHALHGHSCAWELHASTMLHWYWSTYRDRKCNASFRELSTTFEHSIYWERTENLTPRWITWVQSICHCSLSYSIQMKEKLVQASLSGV